MLVKSFQNFDFEIESKFDICVGNVSTGIIPPHIVKKLNAFSAVASGPLRKNNNFKKHESFYDKNFFF